MIASPNIIGPGLIKDFRMALDAAYYSHHIGLPPDNWQERFLRSNAKRIILNCSRQTGKTTTLGTLESHAVTYRDGIQVVNVAPGLRQSRELFRKVMTAYRIAGRPVRPRVENKLELELENDSRVVALPGSEGTIRGFSGVDILVFEEAARIPDVLYYSVRPMIATRPDACIIIPSTPYGARGFFYKEKCEIERKINLALSDITGETTLDEWEYFEVPAEECPRITPEFLAEERESMGEWWFEQEYHCKFQDAQTSAFRSQDIEKIITPGVMQWSL